jgi:hypothetical protein
MDCLISEITNLTEEWYFLIGKDHHKDRDCHWYIETKWSYGYPPTYTIYHAGYILHDFEDIECSSYIEALEILKTVLIKHIKQETENQKEDNEF